MIAAKSITRMLLKGVFPAVVMLISVGCGDKEKEKKPVEEPTIIYKKDTASVKGEKKIKNPPIINITDTVALKQLILYIKDSAATSERIGKKMTNIYNNLLADVIKINKLKKTGPRMAWYRSSSAPFFFEAGIPIDKKPLKLPKKIAVKNIGGDSIVVAHFYGPYELTSQAYEALSDWMKSNNKKAAGSPYEIYVDSPFDANGKPVDPYRVRTDIIFPYK